MYNNRVKLNLHKYKTAGMNQFNIDKLSDDDFDEEDDEREEQSSESELDDDDFSSGSESFPDTESTGPSEATTESDFQIDRMRAPMCGLNAHSKRMSLDAKMQRDMHRPILADNKHVFQTYDDSISIDDSSDLYSKIERRQRRENPYTPSASPSSSNRFRVPRQPKTTKSKGLTMIEELSPIRSDTLSDVPPPMPPSLRSSKSEWNPQLTSTTTSFQPLIPLLPKTNPRIGHSHHHHQLPQHPKFISSTPRMTSSDIKNRSKKSTRNLYSRLETFEKTDSLTGESDFESPVPWNEPANLHPMNNSAFCRAEHYGLPSALAKNLGINGIVFLSMSLCGRRLTVNVQKGVYFRDSSQSHICSYVRAELRHRTKSHQMPKRYRASSSGHRYEETYRTRLVPSTNRPTFQETFQFKLSENCGRDYLALTVYSMEPEEPQRKKILGCMAFPVSRLLKKARQANADYFYYQAETENMEEVEINNDGYFLLDSKYGEKRNLPQSKVKRQTYYNDPTLSGTSGSSFTSQGKMTATSSRLSVPNEMTMADYYCSSSDVRVRSNPNHHLDYTSASSSTNGSSSAAAAPAQIKPYRATLPSITTTTSENTSDDAPESPVRNSVDHHYLYAENGGVYGAGPMCDEKPKQSPNRQSPGPSVRRAASFTFSPKGTAAKNNQRPAALLRTEEEKEKRKFFGPISKTLSYLRNKMDSALSTSSLYPTKEEVRLWERNFEALLNSKYGCALFRQFLKKEFSDENVDFWQECEEFKKMKDGKKATTQKAIEIYHEYVVEHSPKEVNLDSDTRAATKAALENGCRTDTFSLAQNRVEQLMSKDSYRRFLRDRLFLDLVESFEIQDNQGQSCSEGPSSSSK